MIQRCEHVPTAETEGAVILAFRPKRHVCAKRVYRKPASLPDPVDLAKQPGFPDRLRDLLNG